MTTIQEKAAALLQRCQVLSLSSINKDGYPRPVPMAKITTEGISTIYLATGYDAQKTKDFLSNPKAGICFHEGGNSVALTGNIEIITEQTQKDKYWLDTFTAHFPKGPTDPNYIILKFQSNHATIFIEGKFIHRQI